MNSVIRERVLSRQQFATQMAIPKSLMKFEQMPEHIYGDLVYRLSAYIFSESMGQYVVKTPATWWEHLKKDHAPAWFLAMWPVKWEEKTLEGHTMFPEYAPPVALGQHCVIVREFPHMNWSEL